MTDKQEIGVVAMRLVNMHRHHPLQDNSKTCSKCGQLVGLYPTGQRALRDNPQAKVFCHVCALADHTPADRACPAGTMDEIIQESRESYDVGRA